MKILNAMRLGGFSLFLLTLVMAVSSCVKPEGYGGTSSINGTIITSYYNEDYSQLIKEAPAVNEDVYLLFGDTEVVGDKVETGPGGAFSFEYLRPGNYTVYFMGEDSTEVDRKEYVISNDVSLGSNQDFDLGTLKELKTLDYNDGTSSISGIIKLINYKNSSTYPFLEVKDTSFAQEQEVYLVYGEHEFYDERIRTSYDGYFEFKDLIPGEYTIFTYSEDITGGTEMIPVIRTATITSEDQHVEVTTMIIEQL